MSVLPEMSFNHTTSIGWTLSGLGDYSEENQGGYPQEKSEQVLGPQISQLQLRMPCWVASSRLKSGEIKIFPHFPRMVEWVLLPVTGRKQGPLRAEL